jgi:hypothetical protein
VRACDASKTDKISASLDFCVLKIFLNSEKLFRDIPVNVMLKKALIADVIQ